MSQKERKSTSRKVKKHLKEPSTPSSSLSSSSPPVLAMNIYIKIYNFDNLQCLFNDVDDDDEEFEIVAKFLNAKINSSNETTRFRANNENSLEIAFSVQLDVNREEEIFNLCANPILLSLLKHKKQQHEDVIVLGNCNLDMLVLFTTSVEKRTLKKLTFERENSHFRKFYFDCDISNDMPLLKAPYENLLNITFNSIHNFEIKDKIAFGFRAPLGCQVNKI